MLDTTKEREGGIPKTIHPSNAEVRFNSISWKTNPTPNRPDAIDIVFHVETKPVGDGFKGFLIDANDENSGNYEGLVGNVKADSWAFSTGKTKAGEIIERDDTIVDYVSKFLRAAGSPLTPEGKVQWCDDQNNKHSDIESYLTAFCTENPLKNGWYDVCIAGQESEWKGHTNYFLYFPKFSSTGVPIQPVGTDPAKSKLITFDAVKHVQKPVAKKEVDSFTNGTEETKSSASTFSLDTEETEQLDENGEPRKF